MSKTRYVCLRILHLMTLISFSFHPNQQVKRVKPKNILTKQLPSPSRDSVSFLPMILFSFLISYYPF
jgi:hypothetical protein